MALSKFLKGLLIILLMMITFIVMMTRFPPKHFKKSHPHPILVSVSDEHVGISPNFMGVFFEEINHAGAGGLWAELVDNRGFEAGGRSIPSLISPWGVIGDEKDLSATTELVSCFETNPVALRLDVFCNYTSCPPGGVGVYNPGFWGMNIEEGQSYKVVFYIKSSGSIDVMISLTDEDEKQVLAFHRVMSEAHIARNWSKMEITLKSKASSSKSKLQLTTNHNGTIWLDQVSVMPYDTYKGHGFRKDLIDMVSGVGPRFLRFPGGIFSEGYVLSNAFRWKDTVGPWEKRPGHYSFWGYWSDDGLGFLEYLQLAEDLGAEPVWVVNSGISYKDEVKTSLVAPFVQEMLDGIEFARGSSKSRWGSLRAQLGHPQPFSLGFVEIGGGKCSHPEYKGNYLKFYEALKNSYPDIKVISNCDGSEKPLDHPADLYDLHTYATVSDMLELTHHFDKTKRDPRAPKAIVGEYASMYPLQSGTFEGALAEAAFLLSLERNSDVVEMVSYAPLLINRDQPHISWSPAAINFNSSKSFGIASYWVQTFFRESSGARLLKVDFYNQSKPSNLHITVIEWKNREEKKFMKIKVVNFNSSPSKLKFTFNTTEPKAMVLKKRKELASSDLQADNTPEDPTKVIPVSNPLDEEVGIDLDLKVEAHSFTAFDLINK